MFGIITTGMTQRRRHRCLVTAKLFVLQQVHFESEVTETVLRISLCPYWTAPFQLHMPVLTQLKLGKVRIYLSMQTHF